MSNLIQTGRCEVKVNDDTGKLFWHTYDEGSKDGVDLDDGVALEMLPEAFGEGSVLIVKEPDTFLNPPKSEEEIQPPTPNKDMLQLLSDLKHHCKLYGGCEFVKFNRSKLLERINAVLAQQQHA
jgi:hypothetical protein